MKTKFMLITGFMLLSFSLNAEPKNACPQIIVDASGDYPHLSFVGVVADTSHYIYALTTDADKKHWEALKKIEEGYESSKPVGRVYLVSADNDILALFPFRIEMDRQPPNTVKKYRGVSYVHGILPEALNEDSLGDVPKEAKVCSTDF